MQLDFHYYATYCAAYLAGYSHEESLAIGYSSQFVDCCSKALLKTLGAPASAATTQMQAELMNERGDIIALQNITRIWASFHFLPYDLHAKLPHHPRIYMNKYRLICKPNGELLKNTMILARGANLQAAGIAMHILADTWAHSYFAGTPSNVINNTNSYFYELTDKDGETEERHIRFRHNPTVPDDVEKSQYTNSLHQENENSIMNLGHGRAGHLPDYSFIRYKYLPAWGEYEELIKDNPHDYYHAFCQMIYALKYLRGELNEFETGQYDFAAVKPYEEELWAIIRKRQPIASEDWKAFGEKLSGEEIEPFDIAKYQAQYIEAEKDEKYDTFLGRFFLAAMAQKSMVTNKIFMSGNPLAGLSVDYKLAGFAGIKDFWKLAEFAGGRKK